jgi:hypothetical protein
LVNSPSPCLSRATCLDMRLTTQNGKTYHYVLNLTNPGGWAIQYTPLSAALATGTVTTSPSGVYQFNQVWPAANSYGIATFVVQQLRDREGFVGTWYLSDGAAEAFRAWINL